MRVTNGMMRTNAMLNMQKNKVMYDKYLQQYNTQKKIQRPSDDPTIAVRALKYRTTLVEIDQYQRNIDDATSWMDATETAIKDVDNVLDNMVEYVTQAATGTVNAKDRSDINKQLDQYAQYIYEQDMNADYAGRYLFTGFRTDSALLFEEAQSNVIYTIHEPLEISDIRQYSYVYGRAEYETETIYGGTQGIYPPDADAPPEIISVPAQKYASEASQFQHTNRILLSYQDLCDSAADVYEELGNSIDNRIIYMTPTIVYKDRDGNECSLEVTVKSVASDSDEGNKYNEHLNAKSGTNSTIVRVRDKDGFIIDEKKYGDVFFVPETGELVFADDIYDDIRGGSDLMITYQKRDFDKNDIKPEHYFTCETLDIGTTDDAVYNTNQYYNTAGDNFKAAVGYEDMSLENIKAVSNAMKEIQKLDPSSPTYADDLRTIVNDLVSPAMKSEMVEDVKNYMQAELSTNLFYDMLSNDPTYGNLIENRIKSEIYDQITSPEYANHIRQNVEKEYYATDENGKYMYDPDHPAPIAPYDKPRIVYKSSYPYYSDEANAEFNQALLKAFQDEYDRLLEEKMKEMPALVREAAESYAKSAVDTLYDSSLTVAENLTKIKLFEENFDSWRLKVENKKGNTYYPSSTPVELEIFRYQDPYPGVDEYGTVNDYMNYVENKLSYDYEHGTYKDQVENFFYKNYCIPGGYWTTHAPINGFTEDDYNDARDGYLAIKKAAAYPISTIIKNVINESDIWLKNQDDATAPEPANRKYIELYNEESANGTITYYETNGITQDDIDNLVNNLVNNNDGDNYDLVERYNLKPTKIATTGASPTYVIAPDTPGKGDIDAITDLLLADGGIIDEYIKDLAADKANNSGTPLPWDQYSRYAFRPQDIRYQINFSQTVQVNTEGRNAVGTQVGRGIEDIKNSCNELDVIEARMNEIEKRIKDLDDGKDANEIAKLSELKTQLQTQMDLQKSVLVKGLGAMITTIQGAKDKINVALADHGSRYNRMVMTKNKLDELELDTNQAKSDNEDADLGEAYINFTESNVLYQATLNATSKVLGQSLLDFI